MKQKKSQNGYLDSSIILRHSIRHRSALRDFDLSACTLYSSIITKVECLRVLDRWRITKEISDEVLVEARITLLHFFDVINFVEVDATIIELASQSFPLALKSLDAIHLATSLALRTAIAENIQMLTHDAKLALAAKSMSIDVVGV